MATTTTTETGAGSGAGAGSGSVTMSPGIKTEGVPPPDGAGFDSPILCTTAPYDVPMALHAENRTRVLSFFQGDSDVPAKSMLVLQGGIADTRHDTDHEPVFRQESWFQWMFGVKEPDCFGVVDVDSGKTTLFFPRLPSSYAIWMGKLRDEADFKAEYEVDDVKFVDELESFLSEASPGKLFTNYGMCSDSGKYAKPADIPGASGFDVDKGPKLFHAMTECRVIKTELELELMRYVACASSEAHMAVMAHCRPGLSEFQLESLFKHWTYYHGGCRHMAYTCICGTGGNSAILHYGHAGAPNSKRVVDGDICLFDMGAEYHCYASDITCSFPANGKFTDDQKLVYTAVFNAQKAVMDAVKPGVNYTEMHAVAYRAILTTLTEGGLLKGDVDAMMEANLGAVFMPHGLGHFIGLDTHDVGGYPEGTERSDKDGFKSLRTVRELKANMTLTIEPGVYFNDMLLDAALADPDRAGFINNDMLPRFRGWGGVRLEDVVRITETGMENFTWCPRTVEDVEAVCAGTLTSRLDLTRYTPTPHTE